MATAAGPAAGRVEIDELTLKRAQRGEPPAFRRLVDTYQRSVFAILSRMLAPRGRRARVEDLAQETFLRVYRALPAFDPQGPARLSSWILTIATRLALDELDKADRLVPLTAVGDAAAIDRTDAGTTRREAREALNRAVAALEPGFAAVFLLREVHELEYDEIARALGIDLGTVKSRLHRAREKLRAHLEELR